VLEWPGNSPDTNVLENISKELKNCVIKTCCTTKQLTERLLEVGITIKFIQLVQREAKPIQQHIQAFTKPKESPTKYYIYFVREHE
jgi:hypothetical protein